MMGRQDFSHTVLIEIILGFSRVLVFALACSAHAANPLLTIHCCARFRKRWLAPKPSSKWTMSPRPTTSNIASPGWTVFDASAIFGALRSQQRGSARFLRVVVRIGDYKQDSYYGSGEGTVDMVPLDDNMFAIRHRVWLATDRAYKAAGEALSAKQAALKQMKVDDPVDDFAHATPVESVEPLAHLSTADFTPWVHLLEESSALYRSDPKVEHFESGLRFEAINHYFVNSEGTVARSGSAHYTITIAGSTQAADGMVVQRSHEDEAKDPSGLPSREKFLKTTATILDTLKQLQDAPVVEEEYRGPILFSNDAAASVVR